MKPRRLGANLQILFLFPVKNDEAKDVQGRLSFLTAAKNFVEKPARNWYTGSVRKECA